MVVRVTGTMLRKVNKMYTIVENAGYIGERDISTHPSYWAACNAMSRAYDSDEIESLHVKIAFDGGEHRTYEI
jgi:hypothetical protein